VCLVKPIQHAEIPKSEEVLKFGGTIKVTCAEGYGINGSKVNEQHITCQADETINYEECHGEFMLIFVNLIKQLLWKLLFKADK